MEKKKGENKLMEFFLLARDRMFKRYTHVTTST